jgi:TonB-linked SusC/RagA family outer membrane protein
MGKILRTVLLFISFLVCARAMAQEQGTVVKGTVTDEKGVTIPGASVAVKGTTKGTVTDINGNYTILVPPQGKILVFSFIGMERKEVVIGDKQQINASLTSTSTALSDVVVIGYGQQKRQDVNGAISSVTAKDIANIPQVSIDQMLEGKAAGLTIQQNSGGPGSNTSVHIRGVGSLSGTNEPLYVIDGIAISGDANNISTTGKSVQIAPNNGENGVSPLSFLNPSDIESIDILKDASATAIYGSRGSNGVIIITTKRGKNGTAKISYNGFYGTQNQGKELKMMDLQQYANLENSLADIIGNPRRGEFANPDLLGPGTNWQDAIFKAAPIQSHQVSLSGAQNGTDYYISGGYLTQDGTVVGSNFDRYTFRATVNSQIKEWMSIGANVSGSRSNQNTSLSNNNGIIYTALLSAPDQAVYNTDGTFAGPAAGQVGAQINPVAQALLITNTLGQDNYNASVYSDLKFTKDLTLHSEFDVDINSSVAKYFNPAYDYDPLHDVPTATLQEYRTNSTYWDWKEYLTYHHIFQQKHDLTVLGAYELVNSVYNANAANISDFVAGNTLQSLNLGSAPTAGVGEYVGNNDILQSEFARAIYTYDGKYSATATMRADRSSKFAQGHQTGYFPSAAVSWRLSDEPFMAKIKQVADNIKIRVGYGQTGNQNVPSYLYGAVLNAVPTGAGTGFAVNNIANPDLKWETAIQENIGVDFGLFNDRITGSFDVFNKTSKNFLFQATLPAFLLGGVADYSGAAAIAPPYINGGGVQNRGFEFSLSSKNIVGKDFSWSTNLNFSHYNNKVTALAPGTPYITGQITTSFLTLPVTRTVVGGPIGEFYGYKVQGVFKTDAQLRNAPIQFGQPVTSNPGGTWLGDIQYVDENHDGKIDANDQVPLGNPNPKFTYGISNTFNYKSFDLTIFLNGSYGAKILNALDYQIGSLGSEYQNQLASVANFWSPTNPTSNVPRPVSGANANVNMSDRFIESGSYLRVQNVTIGYNLPTAFVSHLKLSRLRVYATGQNLYVFTPYKGLDPEVGAANQNVFLTGVDQGRYPIPRTISFGINADF